ncbi:MAG: hypothetical protein EOP06_10810 [Proteobacteria bacterium]|nr:MAG: hypothetical protein EOP06_10810 [Pseudomonadota bacterium]
MNILVLNGSINGDRGNVGAIIKSFKRQHKDVRWNVVHLKSESYSLQLKQKIAAADALLFLTGTYWDSWGSPLQQFLEEATELEADPIIVGKPAGVCVLMHSVGGKAVLSRLQGVLSSMGFLIPPMSGLAHSLAGQLALTTKNQNSEDFWSLQDLDVIIENLKRAGEIKTKWQTWEVDRKNFRKKWV